MSARPEVSVTGLRRRGAGPVLTTIHLAWAAGFLVAVGAARPDAPAEGAATDAGRVRAGGRKGGA